MSTRRLLYICMLLVGMLFVSGCGGNQPVAQTSPTEEAPAAATSAPTESEEPTATAAQESAATATTEAPAEETADLPDMVIGNVFFLAAGWGPPLTGTLFEHRVAHQLYDGLVGWSAKDITAGELAEPVPNLAESWEVSEDGTEFTFTLRPDLTFSNGNPLDAAAVQASFERTIAVLEANDRISRYSWVELIDSMEAVDETTFRMTLSAVYAPLLAALASNEFKIVDVQATSENEQDGDLGAAWLATASAGSGPFVVKEYVAEQRLVLERNENYWGGFDGVNPSVQQITLLNVPENATRELMIGTGEIDIALELEPISLTTLQSNSAVAVDLFPGDTTCNFLVDLRIDQLAGAHPTVLQALRYATDYEGLKNVVAGGMAEIQQSHFLPGMIGYEEETAHYYTYDPDKARELLAEAGITDFPLKIHNRTGSCGLVAYGRAVEFWQQNLAEVGIQAEIIESTSGAMWGPILEGEFRDAGISGMGVTYFDPDQPASTRAVQESQLLGWLATDPESASRAQELTQQGQIETDPEARQEIYAEISRLMVETGPMITVLQPMDAVVRRQTVGNVYRVPGAFPIDFRYLTKEE